MNPLMRYDALMLVGREKAAQALADEVARRVLDQLEPETTHGTPAAVVQPDWHAAIAFYRSLRLDTGRVVDLARFTVQHCAKCGATRRHFVLDSGDAVCIRCCGPGEDFGGEDSI